MSGIYIPGMEMPENCFACNFAVDGVCVAMKPPKTRHWRAEDVTNYCPLVEQKHGQWIKADDGFDESWVCSECMEEYVSVDADFIDYAHYCPNCGARMDGANDV